MYLKEIDITKKEDLESLSHRFNQHIDQQKKTLIFLEGELGTGKTTFVQCLLKDLGLQERVKSPTYSVIEPYNIGAFKVYHIDLYRIQHQKEIVDLGLEDLFKENALFLIEWPRILISLGIQADFIFQFSLSTDGQRQLLIKGNIDV